MKTEPNMPASPCMMQQVGDNEFRAHKDGDAREWRRPEAGLTKREYFAAMAMQGLRSNPDLMLPADEAAKQACNDADALIAELNKNV